MVRWPLPAVKQELFIAQFAQTMAASGMSSEKTNVVRLCEAAGIAHSTHPFPVDDEHLDAVKVAALVGFAEERVFKTLVCYDGAAHYMVFVVPAPLELNLKKAALLTEVKKIELIPVAILRDVTGYIRGGCSPIGMRKQFPTWVDETAQLHETVLISAGIRGLQIELAPRDLCHMAHADFGDIT